MPTSTCPLAVRDWVQPGVLDLAAAKIAKVTIEIPGEEPLVIARDEKDASKHTLVSIPDGKKLKEGAGIDGIVRAAGLDRAGGRAQAGGAGHAGRRGGRRQDRGRRRARRDPAPAQGGRGLLARARGHGGDGDAKKTADEIAAKAQGWEFKIPAAKAQSILKRRADLFEAS